MKRKLFAALGIALLVTLIAGFVTLPALTNIGSPQRIVGVNLQNVKDGLGTTSEIGYMAFKGASPEVDPETVEKPTGALYLYKMTFPGYTKYGVYTHNAYFIFRWQSGVGASFNWN